MRPRLILIAIVMAACAIAVAVTGVVTGKPDEQKTGELKSFFCYDDWDCPPYNYCLYGACYYSYYYRRGLATYAIVCIVLAVIVLVTIGVVLCCCFCAGCPLQKRRERRNETVVAFPAQEYYPHGAHPVYVMQSQLQPVHKPPPYRNRSTNT